MTGQLVCGVDEAGRGPVIGPLVLGCVVMDAEGLAKLGKLKVRDSKRLSPDRRTHLEPLIKEVAVEWHTQAIPAADIDRLRQEMSLNLIEAKTTAKMILALENQPGKIIIDAADSVEANYAARIVESISALNPEYVMPELVCEHKADDNYLEVSAASILAKVERDRVIERLKVEFGDFGSGYPSDPLTQEFIRQVARSAQMPSCVRRSWKTLNKHKQTSLNEY